MASKSHTDQKAAFSEVYRCHLVAIANYAGRRVHAADAVDVVAETFAIAWRRFDDIPSNATRPWLYGVARRVLANQRRGALRRSALHDRLCAEWVAREPATSPEVEVGQLTAALNSLREPDREILILAGVEELKPADIAVVLDVSPEVARNRLSRARSRLREALYSPERRLGELPPDKLSRQ